MAERPRPGPRRIILDQTHVRGHVTGLERVALDLFTGRGFGATGEPLGEVVFNTSMTGYQEVLTDPSYTGQIVTMPYPLIAMPGRRAFSRACRISSNPVPSGSPRSLTSRS